MPPRGRRAGTIWLGILPVTAGLSFFLARGLGRSLGASPWIWVGAWIALAWVLPLMFADRFLSVFRKTASPKSELRWMVGITVLVQGILLGGGFRLRRGPLGAWLRQRRAQQVRVRPSPRRGEGPPSAPTRPPIENPKDAEPSAPSSPRPVLPSSQPEAPRTTFEPEKTSDPKPRPSAPAPSKPVVLASTSDPDPDSVHLVFPEDPGPSPSHSVPRVPSESSLSEPELEPEGFAPEGVRRAPLASPEVQATAARLSGHLEDPREIVEVLHDFVAKTVAYDVPAYRSGSYPPQDPDTVLKTRRAVCQGYSELLGALVQSRGIPSRVVSGYARRGSESWGQLLARSNRTNHAWNLFWIDDRWVPVDSTWDAGFVEGSQFLPKFRRLYFDPDPDFFAQNHSGIRPDPDPADPSNYLFAVSSAQTRAWMKEAMQEVLNDPARPPGAWKVHAVSEGVQAGVRAGVPFVLVQIEVEGAGAGTGCRVVDYQLRRSGLKFRRFSSCPDGVFRPGAYDPPAGLLKNP